MKKNGTTSAGKTRWRCKQKDCGASTTRSRTDKLLIRDFNDFHKYVIGNQSLAQFSAQRATSRWTLDRRFSTFWLIDVPINVDQDRIYDQVFIDGTYTGSGCLLIAASTTHVIAWHWAKKENTEAYKALLAHIPPPLCVVLDGGQGAYSAIKQRWPDTIIQRCLVHAQRVVRRYTTSKPRTVPGKEIYALALNLTRIRTVEQQQKWLVELHNYGMRNRSFLNAKTKIPVHKRRGTKDWQYTHERVRKAYNSLTHLARKKWPFNFLTPPEEAVDPKAWKATTNSLEGGFNAQLKLTARLHRGRPGERQRKMLDWWLHSKTQLPDDPLEIARQCNFGQDQLAKVNDLKPEDHNAADHETGRPAFYDKAIPTEYNHSVGIRKGPMR